MTVDPKALEAALLPCPVCGSGFLMAQEPHDNGVVAGMFYIFHDYGPIDSAARKCPVEVNGYFPSAAEAATAWNRRAALPQGAAAAGVKAKCEHCAGSGSYSGERGDGNDCRNCGGTGFVGLSPDPTGALLKQAEEALTAAVNLLESDTLIFMDGDDAPADGEYEAGLDGARAAIAAIKEAGH